VKLVGDVPVKTVKMIKSVKKSCLRDLRGLRDLTRCCPNGMQFEVIEYYSHATPTRIA
jgi:hypothetical protein